MARDTFRLLGERLEIPALRGRTLIRRVLLAGLILALGGAGIAYALAGRTRSEIYRTAEVVRRNIARDVELTGRLEARNPIDVPSTVQARLVEILAAPGDSVSAGQVIARLDEREAELEAQGARARSQAARARVAEARAMLQAGQENLDRTLQLAERGLASQADLSQARAEVARARAAVQTATAEERATLEAVERARLGQNLAEIRSPVNGVVIAAPSRVGAVVGPELGPLFRIGDPLEVLRIEAPVGEADIAELEVGQPGRFDVPAYPGRSFEAEVERIDLEPRIQDGTVTYPVTLRVENAEGALLPGMTATLRIRVGEVRDVLAVPEAALRFAPTGAEPAPPRSRIWVRVSRRELRPVEVRTGLSDGASTEIRPVDEGAIAPGDPVTIGLVSPGGEPGRPQIRLGDR